MTIRPAPARQLPVSDRLRPVASSTDQATTTHSRYSVDAAETTLSMRRHRLAIWDDVLRAPTCDDLRQSLQNKLDKTEDRVLFGKALAEALTGTVVTGAAWMLDDANQAGEEMSRAGSILAVLSSEQIDLETRAEVIAMWTSAVVSGALAAHANRQTWQAQAAVFWSLAMTSPSTDVRVDELPACIRQRLTDLREVGPPAMASTIAGATTLLPPLSRITAEYAALAWNELMDFLQSRETHRAMALLQDHQGPAS